MTEYDPFRDPDEAFNKLLGSSEHTPTIPARKTISHSAGQNRETESNLSYAAHYVMGVVPMLVFAGLLAGGLAGEGGLTLDLKQPVPPESHPTTHVENPALRSPIEQGFYAAGPERPVIY